MIVPEFWAEARLQQPRGKDQKQITVRRFGWSAVSQADADQMAGQRAQEALKRITTGEKLLRRERKIPYNGAEGLPIREEVLSRHGEIVITRNSYGAHCLNTPNVLFADIDFAMEPSARWLLAYTLPLLAAGILAGVWLRSFGILFVSILVALFLGYSLAVGTHKLLIGMRGGPERLAKKRIASFVRRHRDWLLRIYQTPAGLRVLVLQRTFKPAEPAVADFFKTLGVDPLYAKMCRNQQCFRARVSPKPWRIGISNHMRPRPGFWPVSAERMADRNAWIGKYETAAARFASCRFLEAQGQGITDPEAAKVRDLHDRLSQALSGREIA